MDWDDEFPIFLHRFNRETGRNPDEGRKWIGWFCRLRQNGVTLSDMLEKLANYVATNHHDTAWRSLPSFFRAYYSLTGDDLSTMVASEGVDHKSDEGRQGHHDRSTMAAAEAKVESPQAERTIRGPLIMTDEQKKAKLDEVWKNRTRFAPRPIEKLISRQAVRSDQSGESRGERRESLEQRRSGETIYGEPPADAVFDDDWP